MSFVNIRRLNPPESSDFFKNISPSHGMFHFYYLNVSLETAPQITCGCFLICLISFLVILSPHNLILETLQRHRHSIFRAKNWIYESRIMWDLWPRVKDKLVQMEENEPRLI